MIFTKQIRSQLEQEDLSVAEYTKLQQRLADHRAVLKSRLAAIPNELRAEPERVVELNKEDESIEVELGVLYGCEEKLTKLLERAHDQAAGDVAKRALKRLPATLEQLSAAQSKHAAAASQLEALLAELGLARSRLGTTHRLDESHAITEADLETICALQFWPEHIWPDTAKRARRMYLRRDFIGPEPIRYAERAPDYAELAKVRR